MISLITLVHNKLPATRLCLPTLLRSSHRPLELIVVDNASTDGTPAWLKEFTTAAARSGVTVKTLSNRTNPGCSTARNAGAALATGDRLVFLDNDVALRSVRWLQQLSATLDSSDRIAIVGPKFIYPLPPHAIQCAGAAISRSGRVQFMGRGEPRTDPRFNTRREVQCLISACIMMRTSDFRSSGGFDEAFNPIQFEDFDLCYRLRERGRTVLYEPAVEMYHLESTTSAGTPSIPNTAVIIRNGLKFKDRWRHMFEKEDGPPDSATRWLPIPPTHLDQISSLPVLQ